MEIVTQHQVSGMVSIKDRYELPPTIVMPFVEGLSLEEALRTRPDLPWAMKLDIAHKIGKIVSAGHALPQTILHRDLKPSNIMIENFEYKGLFDPSIVVLDFDMSWHKGSRERDVVFESRDDFGYLAPEQTDPSNRYTARSTRVDSYGFGMVLYYIFGLEAPRPNEALSDRWLLRALSATQRGYEGKWKSAPQRLARLITRATQIDQNSRADFATIVRELEFLKIASNYSNQLENPELWAEEIMSALGMSIPYDWSDGIGEGVTTGASGIIVTVSSNFRTNLVILNVEYSDIGMRERGGLNKYLSTAMLNAESILKSSGWRLLDRRTGRGGALIQGECDVATLRKNHIPILVAAESALKQFAFQ